MEDDSHQGDESSVENERDGVAMGAIFPPDECQIVAAATGNFLRNSALPNSGSFDNDRLISKGNLEFFEEQTETNLSQWIESVRNDTR